MTTIIYTALSYILQYDQVPYDVVKKIEDLEIRRYPEVIFAVVEDNVDDSGFDLLFQYISGENKTRSKIAMTAPVVTSEKIKMTTPVITRKNYMAFAIPSSYNKNTVPIPTNPSVKIEIQPKKTMAVLQIRWQNSKREYKNTYKNLSPC